MYKLSTRKIGGVGEKLAAKYLQKNGYIVLRTNWTCRYGELDLIVSHNREIIFVEVKYVTNSVFCNAVDLFNYKKQRNLYRTIQIFVHKYPKVQNVWRADLVCLTQSKSRLWIQHYKNVLQS